VITESSEKLRSSLDIFDGMLSTQNYISKEAYSVADIGIMPVMEMLFKCGEEDMLPYHSWRILLGGGKKC
ncbi:hypothetical protein K432DRAFT_305962, partial [Lepidopterella palustris CBS 459.81]